MASTQSPAHPSPRWFLSRTDYVELALLALLIVLVRGLPRWILGQDGHVTIHDNLDSDFLYRVLINRPGRLFDYSGTIPEMLGGVPRWTLPSGSKFSSLVFHFLEPFSAYCLLEQTVGVGGAAGLWLLLRDYVPSPRFYRAGIVLSFGLLPFMPIYDGSVAGQPLVLWALLNAWFGRMRLVSLAICGTFAFFSVLQMSGLFVVAGAGIGIGAAALSYKRSWRSLLWPFSCVIALGCGYLVTDYGFLSHYLLDGFVSHRDSYSARRSSGALHIGKILGLLVLGRYHAASHHLGIAMLAVSTATIAWWRGRRRSAARVLGLCLLSVLVACSYELFRWPGVSWLARAVPTLGQITPRFWWSFPLLWYLIWGLAMELWPRRRWAAPLFGVFLALQLAFSAFHPQEELRSNYALLAARVAGRRPPRSIPTYRGFLSKSAVQSLREYVGDRSGHYLCLGFHPSVLQYQGLRTADGYRDLYTLAYKIAFRRLMEADLARDKKMARYFDDFGGRVYYLYPNTPYAAFSTAPFERPGPQKIRMNRAAAEALDVRWVVSTFRIDGPAKKFLHYERKFEEKGGFSFYLYSVE